MEYNRLSMSGILEPVDLSALSDAPGVWAAWGFEPWSDSAMAGVYRRVTISKGALLGEVARYYADDYIVWKHRGEPDWRRVRETWRPARDVMVQRFVFVASRGVPFKRVRSFAFGLKGFLEVYHYPVKTKGDRRIKDLVPLIDKAWGWAQKHADEQDCGLVSSG